MWTNTKSTIKCPRGDCIHYSTPETELPCRDCTCNQYSSFMCRAFRYESKLKGDVQHDRDRAEPPVLGEPSPG